MIYDKALLLPKRKARAVRFTVDELRRERSLRTIHLRENREALVLAEGEEALPYSLPDQTEGFYACNGMLFAFSAAKQSLVELDSNESYGGLSMPMTLIGAVDKRNNAQVYCITAKDVNRISKGTTFGYGAGRGGSCGALHAERVFSVRDSRVYYSDAIDCDVWTEGRGQGGYLDLPSENGNIHAAVSYKEKLYLFRERGITQLRTLGDELNFKAVTVPYGCGEMVKGSVACCGEKIYFFTEYGFYAFNGGACTRVDDPLFDDILFKEPVQAVAYHGKYYARVLYKSGARYIYCYDPICGRSHFCALETEQLAAGKELYFLRENKVYRMTERGYSGLGDAILQFTCFGLSEREKVLESLMIEGKEEFAVRIITENGDSCEFKIEAGKKMRLPTPPPRQKVSF